YYHRLHEKSVAGLYHRQAPLNQLVDFLPAEHQKMRQFQHNTELWLLQKTPAQLNTLQQQLRLWQDAAQALATAPGTTSAPIFSRVAALSASGLELLSSIATGQKLSANDRQKIEHQLQQARTIEQELIIALHRPIAALLDASQQH
ncbi:hypothetical protein, partial [Rheinheimera sp.]|uniref:hypothetical protein n=1 Tax=Rheinheimera sp. TaxID=1869214 RepID=UPI0026240F3D